MLRPLAEAKLRHQASHIGINGKTTNIFEDKLKVETKYNVYRKTQ